MEKWTRLLIVVGTLLLLLALLGVVIHLAAFIQHTLLIFSLAALVAYALNPLVEGLRRAHFTRSKRLMSRKWSVAFVFLGLLTLVGLAGWALGGQLVLQVRDIQKNARFYHDRALALADEADEALEARNIPFRLTNELQHPPPDVVAFAAQVGRQVFLPIVGHAFLDLGEALIILLIALYFLLFGHDMRERFNALLPPRLRGRVDLWESDMNRILGGFVRGQLAIALVLGIAAAVGCLAMGIQLWLVIGLFVVITSLVPVFGPYIGGLPAVVAALVSPNHFHSPVVAAIVVIVYFSIINEVGSKILYPKLVGDALGLHMVLVLFVLIAGLEVAGIEGVLFAAPLTALSIITMVHLYRFWQELPDSLLAEMALQDGRKQEN